MRTGTWLYTAALMLALPAVIVGCGDDTAVAGGGQGGSGGNGGSGGDGAGPQGGNGGTGAAGGDGGAGAAGGGPTVFDSCDTPGSIDLAQDDEVFVQGTMAGSTDDYTTFCGDADGMPNLSYADVVYAVDIAESCTATFTLEGQAGFDGVLGLRTVSCTADDFCSNTGSPESVRTHVEAGTVYLIVSDANDSNAGFTLGASCATPACGDSVLNPDEDCDDGNTTEGDGCDAVCALEPADPEVDTCAGATSSPGIGIDPAELIFVPEQAPLLSTIGATDSGTSTCQTGQQVPAPDHVYKVIPSANGTLVATVGADFNGSNFCVGKPDPATPGCWDRAVHIREATCDDPQAQLGCADSATEWFAVEEVSVQVEANTAYYVFVDGYNGDEFGQGLYVLSLELQ